MSNPVDMFVGESRALPNLDDINGAGAKFAFVQLILAERSRTNAVDLMEKLENEKKEIAEVQTMLNKFKEKMEATEPIPGGTVILRQLLSKEDIQWCKEKGIDIPGGPYPDNADFWLAHDHWEGLVANTQRYADGLGDNSQSLMVLIQDALGQYNAFTQGASSNVSSANSIMQGLARW